MEAVTGQHLLKALKPVLRHISWQHYVKWLVRGFTISSGSALLVFTAARMFPIYNSSSWVVVLSLLLLLSVMLRAFKVRPGLWEAALSVDRAGLKERATTAWQLQDAVDGLAQRQRQDALEHLNGFAFKKALPWPRYGQQLGRLTALLVVVLVLALWPNRMDEIARLNHEAKEELIATQGVVQKVEELLKNDPKISADLKRQLADDLTKLQQELKKAKSLGEGAEALAKTQKELTTKLSQTEEKQNLDKLAFRLQQNPATKGTGAALQKRDVADLRQQTSELEKKIKEMEPAEREKLAKFFEEIAKSQEKAGNSNRAGDLNKASQAIGSSGQAGAEEMANLSEQLAQQLASDEAATRIAGDLTEGLSSAKEKVLATANRLGAGSVPSGAANSQGSNGSGNPTQTADSDKVGKSGNGSGNNGSDNGKDNAAGSGSGTGTGTGSGTGSGSGTGGGSGGGGGSGKSGNNAGSGTSNQTSSMNGQTKVGAPGSSGIGGNGDSREGHWDQVYVPSGRVGNGGVESRLGGSAGNNSGDSTMVDAAGGLAQGGSLLPYSEVFTQYEAEARESMDKESVPDNLKTLVRSYFLDLSGE
ncbi:MAG: hypothetical protein P4L59_09010 [Desulfosporosinus sp.]|nr:hypothetical protein [Desulfosporosinus sp.]